MKFSGGVCNTSRRLGEFKAKTEQTIYARITSRIRGAIGTKNRIAHSNAAASPADACVPLSIPLRPVSRQLGPNHPRGDPMGHSARGHDCR